jgi:riboflavin kinase/FMN adenylyltransferase
MQLHRDLAQHLSPTATPSTRAAQVGVVTLGNFDGVHLGHQALIKALHTLAKPQGLALHVVTFAPHPRDYFAAQGRGQPVQGIGSVRDRLVRLTALGADHVHLLRFNQALATLSPQDFIARVLVHACAAKHVVVGRDVRFGHQRGGDLALLRTLGAQYGFAVHAFDDVLSAVFDPIHPRIASATVRRALQAGNVAAANALLGYDYSISARVIHGRKLGRTLGCPTLNLIPRLANPAFRGIVVNLILINNEPFKKP